MIPFNTDVFWFILAIEMVFLEGALFYHLFMPKVPIYHKGDLV